MTCTLLMRTLGSEKLECFANMTLESLINCGSYVAAQIHNQHRDIEMLAVSTL